MGDSFFKISKGVNLTPQTSEPAGQDGDVYYNSTLGQFRRYENGAWKSLGSGNGSGINYILNPDAEANADGYAAYADAAGVSPVDGTGGSPNVTWTRSTSSPLRGLGSFLLTKDAANRQGQGASYAFTIDAADKAKVLKIEFDYSVVSGTFVAGNPTDRTSAGNSDVTVWIYDVTNGVVIQPSTIRLYSISTTIGEKFIANFQSASNSTSYRLIFHVGTTSASAYTLKFDNILVGPSEYVYGTPITDWISFTPTNPTNATASKAQWRRVGGNMEINIGWSYTGAGSTSFAKNQIVPSGFSVDTARLGYYTSGVNRSVVGSATSVDTGVNGYPGVFIYDHSADNFFMYNSQAFTPANTDISAISISIPIVGWSSTVQMSDSADTRVVAAKYRRTTPSFSASTTTPINYQTMVFDTHGAVTPSATAWKFTAPIAGFYHVSVYLASANDVAPTVYKNGSFYDYLGINYSGTGDSSGSTLVEMNAGDFIDIRPNGAATIDVNTNLNHVSIFRLSGPSAIAATETISAIYSANGQSAPSSLQPINFASKLTDTHSAVTTGSSWKFTAPANGYYQVSFQITTATTGSVNNANYIYKNGSQFMLASVHDGTSVGAHTGSGMIYLKAGEFIDIRMTTPFGSGFAANDLSQIQIIRIGL